jgi:hypothetical protein
LCVLDFCSAKKFSHFLSYIANPEPPANPDRK